MTGLIVIFISLMGFLAFLGYFIIDLDKRVRVLETKVYFLGSDVDTARARTNVALDLISKLQDQEKMKNE